MISDTAIWPTGPVKITWHETNKTELPVTGAHAFCFHNGSVLVCLIRGRGITIPGGHVENGETPEACVLREAAEEACVELHALKLIGFIEADHSQRPDYNGPYPVRSVQAVYRAEVLQVSEFAKEHEADARRFVDANELATTHHEWNAVLQAAFEAAMARAE